MRSVDIGGVQVSNTLPMALIAGPCQLETSEHAVMIAGRLAEICARLGIGFVFKGSFDKANRTSVSSQRGVGITRGLEILSEVREQVGCPVLTDVHVPEHCALAARYVDALQIPAFLCRQTDLLLAAGETGLPVLVKKGQFLAPRDMEHVAAKIASTGNGNILLCERGTSFGYNTLVNDMRGIPQMANLDYPVVIDATHSVQMPGGEGSSSGGQREYVPVIARAAVSLGVAAVFLETHDNPDAAPSDGANMVALEDMPALLETLDAFDKLAKADPL